VEVICDFLTVTIDLPLNIEQVLYFWQKLWVYGWILIIPILMGQHQILLTLE